MSLKKRFLSLSLSISIQVVVVVVVVVVIIISPLPPNSSLLSALC